MLESKGTVRRSQGDPSERSGKKGNVRGTDVSATGLGDLGFNPALPIISKGA